MKTRASNLRAAAAGLVILTAMSATGTAQERKAAIAPAAAAADARPSAAEIAGWLAQLDDRQYRVRERATRQLLTAGAAALEPILAVANGERPEPADRAVWLLQQYGNAKEAELRRAALERLTQLKDRPQVVAAANDALALIRHQEARQTIERLGGRFQIPEMPGIDPRQLVSNALILDENWRGKKEDLAQLRHVLSLRNVFVIGTRMTAADLVELKNVSTLANLYLYGTRLEPTDVPQLKEAMPQATIDYRRGALLGVAGSRLDDSAPARAETVQPGSAAAQAGIQVGDIIERFNGQDVLNFKDLTDKIATHRAGDEVTLEILRNGETKNYTLKLGRWSTEQILKQLSPQ